MKKITVLFFSFLLLVSLNPIFAQTPDWTRVLQFPSVGVQNANVVSADNNFVYVAGVITGPVTFGGAAFTSNGNLDMLLTKITNSGIVVWTKQIQAEKSNTVIPNYISLDASSNIYVSGMYTGKLTIGGSTIVSDASNNAFIAKFDPNGNGIWASSFFATGAGSTKFEIDGGGNVFLISKSNKLIKFNSSGVLQWEQIYQNNTLHAIGVNGLDLFIGGALQTGLTSLGTFNLTGISANSAFIAKADLDGNYSKVIQENTISKSTKDGNYLAVGTFIHPTAGLREINLTKPLIGSSENVLTTSVGDLGSSSGYVTLTINPDSTVSISGLIGTVQPVYASGENKYDPGTGTFTLNYSYDAVGGGNTRIISEVLTKQSGFIPGQSTITDINFGINDEIIVTGGFTKDLFLDTISIKNTSISYYTYIGKCNSNLEFEWIKSSLKFSSAVLTNHKVFIDASNNIYQSAPITSSVTYGAVTAPVSNGQVVIQFDPNGMALNAYPIPNNTFGRFYVTPAGKFISIGSYNYTDAPTYGNLYIEQFYNNMSLEWRQNSTGITSGTIQVNYTKHDPSGNIYVMGKILGYYDYFGNIVNSNSYITFIAKHDNTGKLLWMKQIPDISPQIFGTSFILDKNNNPIMVGLFKTSLNLGTAVLTTTNAGNEGYVAKFSSNGELLWASKMNLSTDLTDYISLTSDNLGNVIVSGVINPSNYLVKFDPQGNQLWAKTLPIESYYMSLVSTDNSNNIYLTSEIHTSGPIMIGSVELNQTLEDGGTALIKFDPNGNALWANTYGGVIGATYSDGWPCAIRNDLLGNTYIWGTFKDDAIFGATTLVNPLLNADKINQNYSYYLAKINPSGGVIWVSPIYESYIGFNYGDLLDLDKNGNAYVAGHFSDTIQIDGTIIAPKGLNDFFVAKYSNNGNFKWVSIIPSNSLIIRGITVLREDVVSIAGAVGTEPKLGTTTILTGSGPTQMIATLGSLCYAQFDYTWTGATNFTDLSVGNPTAWSWDFGDGTYSTVQNPVHNYSKTGIYDVSLSTINQVTGCVASINKKVTAGAAALCQSEFIYDINSVTGLTTFTSKSLNATEYYWNFGDGIFSTLPNPSHTFSKAGIYNVCLTIWNSTNGCQSVSCQDIIFIPSGENYIQSDFSFYVEPTGTLVTFNDLSSSNTTDWYWTFGDGKVSNLKNPVYSYPKAGVYNVCLTVFDKVNSLSQSVCKSVKVGNTACTISSDFSFFVNPVAREVEFFNKARGVVDSYFWTFGDGSASTAENPNHYFAVPGFYTVTLVVRNSTESCIDKYSVSIQVGNVDCRAGYSYNVDTETNTVYFRDDSKGQIDYYYWDMGDGAYSVMKDPEHLYKKAGIYMVGQTVIDNANGCMDFTVEPIQLGEINCAADFITYIDSSQYTAYFTNRVLGESTVLLWSFGDGKFSTQQNPVHKFPGEGMYSAGLNTYNTNNGCMDFYQEMLIIGGIGKDCEADFIHMVDPSTSEVSFNDKSVGDISAWVWNFGDLTQNSYEKNPVHEYAKPGYYNVCLGVINSDGIKNMNCKWILVEGDISNNCLANFMFSIDSANLKVNFVDNSFGEIDNYSWDFGDSKSDSVSFLQNPIHSYDQKGYYMVKLKVGNSSTGCQSKEYKLLNVGELQVLKAAFSYEAYEPNKKIAGYPVDLVSASSGDGATVEWDFGDKAIKKESFTVMDSTSHIVTHYYQFPGKYNVCLRVSDPISGQSDEYCSWVTTKGPVGIEETNVNNLFFDVYPNPFRDFTYINFTLPVPQYIELDLFDLLGRKVETLVKSRRDAGEYQIVFESKTLLPGVYNLKLLTVSGVYTKQIVITK